MTRMILTAALAAISTTALSTAAFGADVTYIHAGTVLAEPGKAPSSQQTIVVEDGKIRSIEAGYKTAGADKVIDLKNSFVLPGLIDSHVHLRSELGPQTRLHGVVREDADVAFVAAHNAKKTLMAGFTAVQDVGGPKEIFALRRAVNAGLVPGPHIRAAGSAVSVTGGHGDNHGYRQDILHMFASPTICDGPAECRHAVRKAVKNGADVIKITATGGVLSNTNAGTSQQFFDDELKDIVETAEKMGRRVTAHAHGKDGIESALNAGVHSIEHGTFLDDSTAKLFKRKNAYLIPTALAGATVVDMAKNSNFLPPASAQKALLVGPRMEMMLKSAIENNVKIAFGTDSGVSKHGDNAKEFPLLVKAGMSEMAAIKSATVVASEHIQMSEKIGTLEPGKYADLIAVDGNPLEDINELLDVDFVMKGGIVYKD